MRLLALASVLGTAFLAAYGAFTGHGGYFIGGMVGFVVSVALYRTK